MKLHRYRAAGSEGQRLRGEMLATDLADLERQLHERGLMLIHGEARTPRRLRAGKLPRRELMHFCFQLQQLLEAGLPPYESLCALREASTDARMSAVLEALVADIERGQALSAAAGRQPAAFAPHLVAVLRAGEHAGRLPEAIRDIGEALRHEDELAAHARRIAIYPAIVAALLLGVVVVALVYVVPELEKLFRSSGQVLPLQTRILIALSQTLIQWWWAMLAAAAALGGLGFLLLRQSPELSLRLHAWRLRLPIVGEIARKLALARFAGLFATLYGAGITVVEALRIAEDATRNPALRAGVRTASRQIEEGRMLSAAFESVELFPPLLARMLRIGEHTGGLDRALDNIAALYRREVSEAIAALQATLEPALTVTMGALLLWIASAVLGPVYGILTQLPV